MAEISAGELGKLASPTPWRARRWLLVTIIVVVGALLALLFWGMQRGPRATVGGAVPLNKPAPNFTVTTLDGQQLALGDLRGKTVVLNI